jgi:uncharacterized protein YjbI with pentapeptide repeats
MLGLHFEDCNEYGVSFSFSKCTLAHSTFYQMKIPGTLFSESTLTEVDFSECDLTGSSFPDCDLNGAVFDNTNLECTNFLTASTTHLILIKTNLRRPGFSADGLSGLLERLISS